MKTLGLTGKGIYADYEFLRGKHPEYFDSQEAARAAVEFVLNDPLQVAPVDGNIALARRDEESGRNYRIEIDPDSRGGANHIRSVHELTDVQFEKAKAGNPSPAILPSQNSVRQGGEAQTGERAKTLSSFLREDNAESGKVKLSLAALPNSDLESLAKIIAAWWWTKPRHLLGENDINGCYVDWSHGMPSDAAVLFSGPGGAGVYQSGTRSGIS